MKKYTNFYDIINELKKKILRKKKDANPRRKEMWAEIESLSIKRILNLKKKKNFKEFFSIFKNFFKQNKLWGQ